MFALLGLLFIPGLLSLALILGPQFSWLLVLIPGGFALLFFLLQSVRLSNWEHKQAENRLNLVPAVVVGVNFLSLVALYVAWFSQADRSRLLRATCACLQHLSTMCGLASALHASLLLQRFGCVGFGPLLIYLLALPFLVAERMPLTIEGAWPQWYDHGANAATLLLGCGLLLSTPLQISVQLGKHKDTGSKSLALYCERFQQFWAVLVLMYLPLASAWHYYGHLKVLDVLYHCIWSFIQPCTALLFLMYWLMRLPYWQAMQALICGLGFVHFSLFAPLTETPQTYRHGTRFYQGLKPEHSDLGECAHRVESLCFCCAIMLFFLHGICSGSWAKAGKALPRALSLLAGILFSTFFVAKMMLLLDFDWFYELRLRQYFWMFLLIHYGFGYLAIVLINMGLFETAFRDCLVFQRLVFTCDCPQDQQRMLPQ